MNKIIEQVDLFEWDATGAEVGETHVPIEIGGGDHLFLRQKARPDFESGIDEIRIADLFCGAGGISLGLAEAIKKFERKVTISWAVDIEPRAISVFKHNFPQACVEQADLATAFAADLDSDMLTESEVALQQNVGRVDILVGGPPCQGHSDLNNFSRRSDPKNRLYLLMARAAKVFQPQFVMIENVPGAKHDKEAP